MTSRRTPPTLGHLEGAAAQTAAEGAVAMLAESDLAIALRPFPANGVAELLEALAIGEVAAALAPTELLPPTLRTELTLVATLRRADPRSALLTLEGHDPTQLPAGSAVGVLSPGDGALLDALLPEVTVTSLTQPLGRAIDLLDGPTLEALLAPLYALAALGLRERAAPLPLDRFVPTAGQGAQALLLRADDGATVRWARSLQHRPSYDRVRAERAFAAGFEDRPTGAHASVTADGDLTLTAWVAAPGGELLQASVEGDAAEAEELGSDLAVDVHEQLTRLV
jgi:hydroxymethylbilane synthase